MAVRVVSDYLRIWQRHFDPDVPKTFWQRVWVFCHGNLIAVLITMTVLTLSTLDCVMVRSSVLDAGPTVRFMSGIYSCGWGCYFFGFKKAESLRTFNQLLKVALQIEDTNDERIMELVRPAAVRSKRALRAMEGYSGFVFMSVIVPALLTGEPANPSWPKPHEPIGRYCLFTLHFFSTVFLPVGFFTVMAMIFGLQHCCAAMYRVLAFRIERAVGQRQVRDVVMLLAELNEGAVMVKDLYQGVYVHLLQSILLMPLIGAYEVVHGQVDPFLFAVGPLNILIFVPLCFAGQSMADASVDMARAAYGGEWTEEDLVAQRLRMLVMQRASVPSQISSRELGPIDRAMCQKTLQSWFSYLQLLLNTTKRTDA